MNRQEKVQLRQLVAECIERPGDEGRICAEHPDLAFAIRRRLQVLRHSGLVAAPESQDFPETLGEYRLLERLGAGGMGVVYRAEQTSLRRQVALKLIRPEYLYFPGARERFQREVEAVAKLQHPHIVPIYAVGEEVGTPYFTMELIDGATLGEILVQLTDRPPARLRGADLMRVLQRDRPHGDLELQDATWTDCCFQIILQVARALEHAHHRGILHRDIKPSNILLSRDGRPMLLDFGLASSTTADRITRSGSPLGSIPYMAPEQIDGESEGMDARTDIYGLGVTLFEMLSLRQAFPGKLVLAREQILKGPARSLRSMNRALAWDVETVCMTAMEVDPRRRYSTVRAFADDVQRILRREPIEARRPGWMLRARRFTQRQPTLVVGVVLGTLLLVGGPVLLAGQQARANRALGLVNAELRQSLQAEELAHQEADHQRRLAEEEEEKARTSSVRAGRNFARSREIVQRMLVWIGEKSLDGVPGMEVVRRRLVRDASEFYQEFLAEGELDPEVRLEMGSVLYVLGKLQDALGELEDAVLSYRRALELLSSLGEGVLPGRQFVHLRAKTLTDLGVSFALARDTSAAEAAYAESAASYRELLDQAPGDPALIRELAVTLLNQAGIGVYRDQLDESIAISEEAQELYASLLERAPGDDELRALATTTAFNLATLLQRAERIPEAEELLVDGMEQCEALLQRSPRKPEYRWLQAYHLASLADLRRGEERFEESLELAGQSEAVTRELAREYPGIPTYPLHLSRCMDMRAELTGELGNLEQAWDLGEQRRELLESLTGTAAQLPETRQQLMTMYYSRALRAAARGDREPVCSSLEAAEQIGHELLTLDAENTQWQRILARVQYELAREADCRPFAERLELARVAFATLDRLERADPRLERQQHRNEAFELLSRLRSDNGGPTSDRPGEH